MKVKDAQPPQVWRVALGGPFHGSLIGLLAAERSLEGLTIPSTGLPSAAGEVER